MIAVQIYYPRTEGREIDIDRYIVHMKMACKACGNALKGSYVLKELPGAGYNAIPDKPFPTHVCIGILLFDSYEDFETKFKPIVVPLRADTAIFSTIKPYTNIYELFDVPKTLTPDEQQMLDGYLSAAK